MLYTHVPQSFEVFGQDEKTMQKQEKMFRPDHSKVRFLQNVNKTGTQSKEMPLGVKCNWKKPPQKTYIFIVAPNQVE